MTFTPGQQYAYLTVSPVDDDTAELIEYFTLMIISVDRPEVVAIGSPNTSVITIADNDGVFAFVVLVFVCVRVYVCTYVLYLCTYVHVCVACVVMYI